MSTTQDVIVTLLTNIGSKKEVEQYLRHYASPSSPKFAVVRVSGQILDENIDSLATTLAFLQRVGLLPVVVHGASPQLDRALVAAGVVAPRVDGLRPMWPEVRDIARRVLYDVSARLVDALESQGTRTRPFTSGVFDAIEESDAKLGAVARVVRVHSAALLSAARSGHLPVITPLAETEGGRLLVVHADGAASALAVDLRPHKVVYLTESGGIREPGGGLRSAINLAEDRDEVFASLSTPDRQRLERIAEMLAELPKTASVSITSPDHLAKELFTHRGAGTLVRLGERVGRHTSFAELDKPRLRALLEECFGKRLHAGYFDSKKPLAVYLAESYRATAILTLEDGVPYLDKFAVTPEAQGEGIGGSLWHRLRADHKKLFWRSRANNPVNDWYAQSADGLFKGDRWWVFFCGMTDFREIESCVKRALQMPATLKEESPGAAAPRSQAQ